MKPRPWSFSSLTLYESCPQKYKLKYLDKEPEPPKAADNAADRGNRVHTDLEGYLKGTNELPEEATKLQDVYDKLLNRKLTIEEDWGFNKDWQPTGWFDDDISCRMKLDLFEVTGSTCLIGDHKTGKDAPLKRIQQGQLYAIGAAAKFPELETFVTEFYYVDQGLVKTSTFKRTQVEAFKKTYEKRVDKLNNDLKYLPVSNKFNCKWCPYGPEGTKVCQFRTEEF